MKKYALGIDLGTTFSEVSVKIGYDRSDIVADQTSHKNIPSIVNFSKKESVTTISVGNFAKSRQAYHPKSTIYDTKRMLGKPYTDDSIQKMIPRWPFKIEQSETGEVLVCIDEIDEKMPPYQITGELLKYLAKLGNSRLSPDLQTNDVVITVPANFHNEQRAETLKAAEYAGLNVLMLLNEPTAAGISYGYNKQRPGAENVFVFDFGGGTLDVSLLHINDSEITVIATDGDLFLGGRDFDERTAEYLLKQDIFSKYRSSNKRSNFIQKVNEAKTILSLQDEASIPYKDDAKEPQEYKLKLSLFEEINRDLIDRILIPVKRLLKTAKIEKESIDSIILVGGSSNMQFVRRKLTDFFGKIPFNGVDPQEAVADGAGIVAAKLINDEKLPKKIKDVEFHEICSHSIGTSDSENDLMDVAIPKGTPIPTQKVVKQFSTVFYRQDAFFVDVLEGESEFASENICIGSFMIQNLPQTENQLNFDISFSLDLNGVLSVEAKLVGGELEGGTRIDIKKVKNNSCSDDNVELIKVNPNFAYFEIFMRNVECFIKFNRDKLLRYYSDQELNNFLEEVNYNIKHEIEECIEKDQLSEKYLNKFAKYFNDNNQVPDFFDCFKGY